MRLLPPRYDPLTMTPTERALSSNPILWIIISLALAVFPALMLPKGIICWLVVPVVILFVPIIGDIVQVVAYIWALIRLFTTPFTIISILFIVALLAYLYLVVLKWFLNGPFVSIMEARAERRNRE